MGWLTEVICPKRPCWKVLFLCFLIINWPEGAFVGTHRAMLTSDKLMLPANVVRNLTRDLKYQRRSMSTDEIDGTLNAS